MMVSPKHKKESVNAAVKYREGNGLHEASSPYNVLVEMIRQRVTRRVEVNSFQGPLLY